MIEREVIESRLSKKEKRQELAAQRKRDKNSHHRLGRVEQKIELAHRQLKKIEAELAEPAMYDEGRKDELTELIHRQVAAKKEVDSLEATWLVLTEEVSS